jgi:hypothetical protein
VVYFFQHAEWRTDRHIEENTRQSSGHSGERDKTFQPVAGGELIVMLK